MNPLILGISDTIESDIPGYENLSLDEKYSSLLKKSIEDLCKFLELSQDTLSEIITDYVTIEAAALGREGYGQAIRDANELGFTGIQCHVVDLGGASVAGALGEAHRITLSNPDAFVLLAGADVPKSAFRQVSDLKRLTKTVSHPDWELPYGATLIGMYSLLANKQMKDSGVTQEDYEDITKYYRNISKNNPRSFYYEKDISDKVIKKYLAPPYSSPMIAIVTDHGFATIVVGASAFSKLQSSGKLKFNKNKLFIVGSSHSVHAEYFSLKGDLSTPAAIACDLAFLRSGYTRNELEYAWIYDCFTGMIISQASAYTGESPKKVANSLRMGTIPLEGKEIPVNRGGGILNYQAAMSMSGATGLVDILSQYNLSRNPIPNTLLNPPALSLLGNNGGIDSINSVVLFSSRDKSNDLSHSGNGASVSGRLKLNPVDKIMGRLKEGEVITGSLLSFTTIFFNPGGDKKTPYVLSLVGVDSTGFVMTNLFKSNGEEWKGTDGLEVGKKVILSWKEDKIMGIVD